VPALGNVGDSAKQLTVIALDLDDHVTVAAARDTFR
jgi:hypothetical protein